MNNSSNILFYSLSCNSCKILLNYLTQHQLNQYFKYICVENYKNHPILNNIKSVPTVIIQEFNQILIGKEIFVFLQNIVTNKQNIYSNNTISLSQNNNTNITNIPTQQNLNKNNLIQQNPQKKILDFVPNEMSGFSDKYAYTFTDIPSSQKFVGSNDSISILTGEELPKITKNNQTHYIKQIENNRKEQDNELNKFFSNNMEKSEEIIKYRKITDSKINDFVLKHQQDFLNI